MRFVVKDLTDIPPKLAEPQTIAQLQLIAAGNKELIDDNTYKGTYKKSGKTESQVREWLNKYYHHKCAYCEMLCKAEIEHYRPKKGVDEAPAHNGYYWLCYEWSNLVPSCRYCNTEGGKGNKFPVAAQRVEMPAITNGTLDSATCRAHTPPLIDEQPLLLHPEIDDPRQYLAFEEDIKKRGILIKGVNIDNRGEATIRICNLNRDAVIISRSRDALYSLLQSVDLCFKYLADELLQAEDLSRALKKIFEQAEDNARNPEMPHTLLWWFITSTAEAFAAIIGPLISIAEQRELVLEAFRQYKAGNL
jgi:uncharacterized protein (TIGR02646 family)